MKQTKQCEGNRSTEALGCEGASRSESEAASEASKYKAESGQATQEG